ncbi:MAG: hypothetical protein HWN81_05635 [Candidatus Lokiarchaeota archaeon]|nr:hypothetical protein [Candidatus Lokiarchaeota archaeon]
MTEVRDTLRIVTTASKTDMQVIDALRNYVNSEEGSDKLGIIFRLINSF